MEQEGISRTKVQVSQRRGGDWEAAETANLNHELSNATNPAALKSAEYIDATSCASLIALRENRGRRCSMALECGCWPEDCLFKSRESLV
jgi:hypothetical protein